MPRILHRYRVDKGMRITLAVLCLMLSVVLSASEVKYRVIVGGQKVGTAKMSQTKAAHGGLIIQIELSMTAGANSVKVLQVSENSADGTPIRKYLKRTSDAGIEVRVVTFKGTTATVIVERGGATDTRTFTAPNGAEIRAKSELWFRTVQPQPGETDTYYRFDINAMRWQLTTVRYEGKRAITVDSKEMVCHLVITNDSVNHIKTYIDDNGVPVRIETNVMVMEREG